MSYHFEGLPFLKHRLQGGGGAQFAVALLGIWLALLAFVQIAISVAALPTPNELAYGEAAVYDRAARLVRGEALYQPVGQPNFTLTIYTPLYYGLAAGLQSLVGSGFFSGRILSFVSGLVAAVLVVYLTQRQVQNWRAGVFAALVFLAVGMPGPIPWFAQYRVDVLGIALSLGAISLLARGISRTHLCAAAVLAALAILTKQSMVAAALAGTVWLWQLNRRKCVLFALSTSVLVLAVSALLEVTTGAFVANVILDLPVPFKLDQGLYNLRILSEYQVGLLAAAGLTVLNLSRSQRMSTGGLLALYWLASFLPLVGMAKVGSNHNYWIELAAVTAILATSGIWSWLYAPGVRLSTARVTTPILLLAVNLAVALPLVTILARTGAMSLRTDPEDSPAIQQVVERVRLEPRQVLADPSDVIVLAGRANWLEPWPFSVRMSANHWDATPILQNICSGKVGLLVLGYSLENGGPQYGGYPLWPRPILAALNEMMEFERNLADRYLYVASPAASQSECEEAAS